jgi:hypothetical protein
MLARRPIPDDQQHVSRLPDAVRVHYYTDARKTPRILPLCATFEHARRAFLMGILG